MEKLGNTTSNAFDVIKEVVKQAKIAFPTDYKELDSVILVDRDGYPKYQGPQDKIRIWLKHNYPNLSWKKPDYFAFFALLISPDYITSWEEIMPLLTKVKYVDHHRFSCCCSHLIFRIFTFENSVTGLKMNVGDSCIEKNCIDSVKDKLSREKQRESQLKADEISTLKTKIKGFERLQDFKDYEPILKEIVIHKKYLDKVQEYFYERKRILTTEYRPCITCDKLNVDVNYPKWRKQCIPCYYA
jgi:hypothetical protein